MLSLSLFELSFSLVVSSIFVTYHYWSERVTMELQRRRDHGMVKDDEQMDWGQDMEHDDGGNSVVVHEHDDDVGNGDVVHERDDGGNAVVVHEHDDGGNGVVVHLHDDDGGNVVVVHHDDDGGIGALALGEEAQ